MAGWAVSRATPLETCECPGQVFLVATQGWLPRAQRTGQPRSWPRRDGGAAVTSLNTALTPFKPGAGKSPSPSLGFLSLRSPAVTSGWPAKGLEASQAASPSHVCPPRLGCRTQDAQPPRQPGTSRASSGDPAVTLGHCTAPRCEVQGLFCLLGCRHDSPHSGGEARHPPFPGEAGSGAGAACHCSAGPPAPHRAALLCGGPVAFAGPHPLWGSPGGHSRHLLPLCCRAVEQAGAPPPGWPSTCRLPVSARA